MSADDLRAWSLLQASLSELAGVLESSPGSDDEEKLATTQAQNQGYELAHPNIHPLNELLEHVKERKVQIQNSRISMSQDNNRISKRSPRESTLSVM